MVTLIATARKFYHLIVYDLADPRTKNYFLVENPFMVILIVGAYVYFTKKLGPRMMRNRKPFKLKRIMMVYNILQILLNVFTFIESYRLMWGWGVQTKMVCEPVDFSYSSKALYITRLVHGYYMMKFMDLVDTLFMVLRKKNGHVSFLHVYHHAAMFSVLWGATKYYPGGHGTFIGFVNSFIHVAMYSYYLVTTLWPSHARAQLWWKKYLTAMQMVQFLIIGVHMTAPLFKEKCDYPKNLAAFFVIPHVVFMLIMFVDFYQKSYKTASKNQ